MAKVLSETVLLFYAENLEAFSDGEYRCWTLKDLWRTKGLLAWLRMRGLGLRCGFGCTK